MAPKFHFFDTGIANYLLKRQSITPGTETFGKVFEHFIYQEIHAHSNYSGLEYNISYWRTASNIEVDFILGDHQTAIEVKGTFFIRLIPKFTHSIDRSVAGGKKVFFTDTGMLNLTTRTSPGQLLRVKERCAFGNSI